ncbi:MAG: DMT family transporter [Rikenellaceae bacterium]
MNYIGEVIALSVAFSWTVTALCSEIAGRRIGALQLNLIRMILSLTMLSITLWWFTGVPYPSFADGKTWFWLSMSGLVGYIFGDFCLFNSYILIGSRFGQLFMTLAPIAAAISGWLMLGEKLSVQALLGMLVTLTGISISVLSKSSNKKLSLNLPLKGVLYGIGAGVGQGVGLVLSKVGMNYYENSIPEGMDNITDIMPFASTFIRAVTGFVGFFIIMWAKKEFFTIPNAIKDKKAMRATLIATITGPFIGVSFSLMAVQYTEAGIASTLMALTPILIIWPSYFIFGQKVTFKEVLGAVISVIGVSLFFM